MAEPLILDYVYARLSAMRVDSCTNEVKECLQSDDRCGADYTQCIGLDTDTIIRMCPYDKLVGCQKVYGETDIRGEAVYDELANMVQGIMLGIDNNFLNQCQNAANEAMIKVCGSTEDCNGLAVDENIGARSLDYKICEVADGRLTNDCYVNATRVPDQKLGRTTDGTKGVPSAFETKMDGQIAWELLDFDEDGELLNIKDAISKYNEGLTPEQQDKLSSEVSVVKNSIDMAIGAIESDPKVQFCMTGREVQGMKSGDMLKNIGRKDIARFPNLTKQMRMLVAASAIANARDSYYKKYDEIEAKAAKDMIELGERIAKNMASNELDARREVARQACVNYAKGSAIGIKAGYWDSGKVSDIKILVGNEVVNTRSYKETITSTFNWENLVCQRCIRKQGCAKMKGKNCRTWGDESETCNNIQF